MILKRSAGFIVGHGPSSKAFRAAATARFTSSVPPFATVATASPVDGLYASNVSPPAASENSPSMKSW